MKFVKLPLLMVTLVVISGCSVPSMRDATANQDTTASKDATANTAAAERAGAAAEIDAAQPVLLDVLVVARHGYRKNMPNFTTERDKLHAELIASQLKALPAAIAASDYQIALADRALTNCIQSVITADTQPDPGNALVTAFRNSYYYYNYSGPCTGFEYCNEEYYRTYDEKYTRKPPGPGYNLPGGGLDALNKVMTALTDLHSTAISWEFYGNLPQEGSHTDNLGRIHSYVAQPDGSVVHKIDGKPFTRYRQLQNGLIVGDYYDDMLDLRGTRQLTCNRSWLREGSIIAIIVIDASNIINGALCRDSWCTMPDIENALRDLGRIDSSTSPLQRHYRLYALTDKSGWMYKNPYTASSPSVFRNVHRSQRPPLAEIRDIITSTTLSQREKIDQLSIIVDWQDFEQYTISNSETRLVDYLGDVRHEQDYAHIFADIAAAISASE